MGVKKRFDETRLNEILPRCLACCHVEQRFLFEDGKTRPLYYCKAPFNAGALIFRDTLLVCDDEGAFSESGSEAGVKMNCHRPVRRRMLGRHREVMGSHG